MAIAHHGRMPGQSCTPSQEHGASYADRACGRHASKPARIEPARQRAGGTGLCGARADPDDRRVIGVCVTPEGRTVMEVAYRRFGSILSQSIDYLGPQNFETLLHLLGELAIALEQAVAAQEEERESDSK